MAPTTHVVAVTRPKSPGKEEPVSARLIASLVHTDRSAGIPIVRFSADGKRLLTAGYPSGLLEFWDVNRRQEVSHIDTPPGARGSSEYVELTADWSTGYVPWDRGHVVKSMKDGEPVPWLDHDGGVLAYDVASGQSRPILQTAPRHGALFASISPDGTALVAVERSRTDFAATDHDQVILWDTRSHRSTLLGNGWGMAAFSPDSKLLAVCLDRQKEPGTLRLFTPTGGELATLASVQGQSLYWPRFSADGKLLYVEQSVGRINRRAMIRIWDVAARRELAPVASGGDYPFTDFRLSPDGKRLAASDYKGGLVLWHVSSGKSIWKKSFGPGMFLYHVRFSPDATRLAAYGRPVFKSEDSEPDPRDLPQPRVLLFDLTSSDPEAEALICPHGYVGGLDFSPDGKLLAAGGRGVTYLFDVTQATSRNR